MDGVTPASAREPDKRYKGTCDLSVIAVAHKTSRLIQINDPQDSFVPAINAQRLFQGGDCDPGHDPAQNA